MSRRIRVYLAGPISKGGLAHNVNQATEAFITLAKAGFAPWCPQWSIYAKPVPVLNVSPDSVYCHGTAQGNPQMSHEDWMGVDLSWVAVSEAVLRLPGESTGADQEVAYARRLGIPVFDGIGALLAYYEKHG